MPKRPRLLLAWDTAGKKETTQHRRKNGTKRSSSSRRQSNNNNTELWTTRYAPQEISELCVAPKKIQQLQQFLSSPLAVQCIVTGNPGVGKSTMVSVVLHEGSYDKYEWVEEAHTENALDSFCDFLRQAPYFPSTQNKQQAVVVVEELPHLHTLAQKERFHKVWAEFLQYCQQTRQYKVIWIQTSSIDYSSYATTTADASALANSTWTISILPVTKTKLLKVIQPILRQHSLPAIQDVSIFQGDVRQALLSLQFYSQRKNSSNSSLSSCRDISLSPFHAMGKLLYAKRNPNNGTLECGVPEQVLEQQSTMGLLSTMYFLQGHAPNFFAEEDVDSLQSAMQYYSDAALLMDHSLHKQQSGSQELATYATTLVSRAVATSSLQNTQKAKHTFRSLTAPEIWQVLRHAKSNRQKLQNTLGLSSDGISLNDFATNVYPYLRMIAPNVTMADLQSFILAKSQPPQQQTHTNTASKSKSILDENRQKEQEEILGMDDIEEFSD